MSLFEPAAILIVLGSFFSAYVSATFAVGGGFIMLAIVSSVVPITVAVPLHAWMMLGLSLGRFWYFRREIVWRIVAPFLLGALIGVFIGGRVYFDLSEFLLSLVIGLLILAAVWMPKVEWGSRIPTPYFWVGVIHSFLSTLFSFGGLFQPLMIRAALSKLQIVGTLAAGLLLMNVLKLSAYSYYGFDYGPWFGVILAAVLAAIPGAYLGKKTLHRIPEDKFRLIFRIIMTCFALRLLYKAWILL